MKCPNPPALDAAMVDYLRYIEDEYDCNGICHIPDYYIFSNVNNGKPKRTCKDSILL